MFIQSFQCLFTVSVFDKPKVSKFVHSFSARNDTKILHAMQCNLCIYLAAYEYCIRLTGASLLLCHMRHYQLMWHLSLDTEWIIVSFSSKGLNHRAYLAHIATAVWCVLLFV